MIICKDDTGFPVASAVKNLTCNAGDVGSTAGGEDPLEEVKAAHSSIPA